MTIFGWYLISALVCFITYVWVHTSDIDLTLDDAVSMLFVSVIPFLNIFIAIMIIRDEYFNYDFKTDIVLIKKRK